MADQDGLLPSQTFLVQQNVKLAILSLTYAQRTTLLRELFTAIYSEGEATESFKILRAYISYFVLPDLGDFLDSETTHVVFSYALPITKLPES